MSCTGARGGGPCAGRTSAAAWDRVAPGHPCAAATERLIGKLPSPDQARQYAKRWSVMIRIMSSMALHHSQHISI